MEETGILEKATLSGPCYPALNQVEYGTTWMEALAPSAKKKRTGQEKLCSCSPSRNQAAPPRGLEPAWLWSRETQSTSFERSD